MEIQDEKPMSVSATRNVDPKAVAMPVVPLVAIILCIEIMVKWGLAAGLAFWFLFVMALLVWGLDQRLRARRQIRDQIEQAGCKVVKMSYRYFRLGPFSHWDTSRSQHVYRVVAREATGRERIVWARFGRRWFWNPHTLEVKWQDETLRNEKS